MFIWECGKSPSQEPNYYTPGKIIPCWTPPKKEGFRVWGRLFFPVQFRFGWFFWVNQPFISRGCATSTLGSTPRAPGSKNVMTGARPELQKTHTVQPPKEKQQGKNKISYKWSCWQNPTYYRGLLGPPGCRILDFFYFNHWTFRFFFLPKELVAELDILRPGIFRNSRSFGVGDETRSRLVQCTAPTQQLLSQKHDATPNKIQPMEG